VRKGLARDVVVEIERHFGDKVTRTKIRSNVRLAEAPSHGKSIFDYAPDSNGAEDYLALGREIVGIEMIQKSASPYVPAAAFAKVAAPEPALAAVGSPVGAPSPVLEEPPMDEPIAAPAGNSADEVFAEVVSAL